MHGKKFATSLKIVFSCFCTQRLDVPDMLGTILCVAPPCPFFICSVPPTSCGQVPDMPDDYFNGPELAKARGLVCNIPVERRRDVFYGAMRLQLIHVGLAKPGSDWLSKMDHSAFVEIKFQTDVGAARCSWGGQCSQHWHTARLVA
jgi:hypothetical protein